MQYAPINDTARHRLHEVGMGYASEVVREVGVNDVRVAAKQLFFHLDHGLLGVAPSTIGVEFWREVGFKDRAGRTREAEPLMEAAVARDPFNPYKGGLRLYILSELGDQDGAQAVLDRAERVRTNAPQIVFARFSANTFAGVPSDAQSMLNDPELGEIIEPSDGPQPVHLMVRALTSRRLGDIDAALRACNEGEFGEVGGETCLIGLAMLDDLDTAYALALRLYPDQRMMT